jgi:RNA polymerase sigma factor (sigma-70 family)
MPGESIQIEVLRHAAKVAALVQRGCPIRRADGSWAGRVWVSPEDHADLVQDVLVKALAPRRGDRYDPGRSYEPYLLMIARNTMIDWMRRRAALTRLHHSPSLQPAGDPSEGAGPPWQDDGNLAAVERYVNGLAGDLREVYRRRYTEGLSQDQAARAMGISRQRLRTLEGRLRHGLARTLETDPPGDDRPSRRRRRGRDQRSPTSIPSSRAGRGHDPRSWALP